jgi:WhiB family transcriptional regulator, redox-sensing transcriptional regulator
MARETEPSVETVVYTTENTVRKRGRRAMELSMQIAEDALGLPLKYPVPPDEDLKLAWQADALCAQTNPESFFPKKGGRNLDAKKVCGRCAVRSDCLAYALENNEQFGIWGGLSERQREKLKRSS